MNTAVQGAATPRIQAPLRPAAPQRLNLGCGADIRAGFVNVDAVARPGVDVVHDLDAVPWPFEDDAFDSALCSHVLEHVRDFHRCLLELQRVCRAGAEIEVIGPYFFSTKFAGDPSHRIPFSYRTFDNYTPPRRVRFYNRWRLKYATNFGAGFLFETIDKRYIFDRSPAIAWIGWLHNLAPLLYERFCPAFLPPMEVYFRLRVVKPTVAPPDGQAEATG